MVKQHSFKMAPQAQSYQSNQKFMSTRRDNNAQLLNSLKGGNPCPTLPNLPTNAVQFVHGASNLTSPNANDIHKHANNNLRQSTVKSQGDSTAGWGQYTDSSPKGKVINGGGSFALESLIETLQKIEEYKGGFKKKSRKSKRQRRKAKRSRKSRKTKRLRKKAKRSRKSRKSRRRRR